MVSFHGTQTLQFVTLINLSSNLAETKMSERERNRERERRNRQGQPHRHSPSSEVRYFGKKGPTRCHQLNHIVWLC